VNNKAVFNTSTLYITLIFTIRTNYFCRFNCTLKEWYIFIYSEIMKVAEYATCKKRKHVIQLTEFKCIFTVYIHYINKTLNSRYPSVFFKINNNIQDNIIAYR
jgi:hypothetical protein